MFADIYLKRAEKSALFDINDNAPKVQVFGTVCKKRGVNVGIDSSETYLNIFILRRCCITFVVE